MKVRESSTFRPITVSVVMPVYNEQNYIESCIKSLLQQDYDTMEMEWIFVDGDSIDDTVALLKDFKQEYPNLISIYSNPNKTVPYSMNIGIREARGKYIIRLDAHAEYNKDYISKCVHFLDTTDADNVGGVATTKSKGFVGHGIALMLSSRFGVGDSQFRTNGKSGYVDTVPFGAFRKEVFEKYGYYNEVLTRNQDNEMNFRIRKNGGKIYLADDIQFTYYCRDSIKGISKMAVSNGKWNVITMQLCPGSMGIRHFVPLVFVLSLVVAPLLITLVPVLKFLFIAELFLYVALDSYFSLTTVDRLKYAPLLLILFPIFHFSYGVGSVIGITKVISKK